jgi:hypothetical protein
MGCVLQNMTIAITANCTSDLTNIYGLLITKANEMHNFSNLYDKVLYILTTLADGQQNKHEK